MCPRAGRSEHHAAQRAPLPSLPAAPQGAATSAGRTRPSAAPAHSSAWLPRATAHHTGAGVARTHRETRSCPGKCVPLRKSVSGQLCVKCHQGSWAGSRVHRERAWGSQWDRPGLECSSESRTTPPTLQDQVRVRVIWKQRVPALRCAWRCLVRWDQESSAAHHLYALLTPCTAPPLFISWCHDFG